ncbi:MAG: tetratricopeptide repeat protein, partial [Bacteroidia bacterium]
MLIEKSDAQKQGQAKIDSLLNALRTYNSGCNVPCLNDSIKVKNFLFLVKEYKYVKPDSAMIFCIEALRFTQTIKWQLGEGRTYHLMGALYDDKGEYFQALKNYSKALDIWEKLSKNNENPPLIKYQKATTLGNMGIVSMEQGDFPKALDYYFKALKIDEDIQNKSGIARHLDNIGLAYWSQRNFSKALEYNFKALKLSEEINYNEGIAHNLGNIGSIYSEQGNDSIALEYYSKALKKCQELNDKKGVGLWLSSIGNAYTNMKQYPEAFEILLKALKISQELNDKNNIAVLLFDVGSAHHATKNYPEAEKYMLQAISISDSIGAINLKRQIETELSEVYSQSNNYKKALEYYKAAMIAKDSLFNEEKTQEITRKEMNYEFDKKETATKAEQEKKDAIAKQELEKQKLLRNSIAGGAGVVVLSSIFSFFFYKRKRDAVEKQQKAEQKQKETSLSLQVSETEMKALRSQMNPHFIFNALQSIQTFLLSNKSEDANTYLLKFSKLMRLVLENSQHSEVSLKEDMQALELYMQLESIRLAHPFTYDFHIDESVDVEETTIPPLILQPFVENAIWHG